MQQQSSVIHARQWTVAVDGAVQALPPDGDCSGLVRSEWARGRRVIQASRPGSNASLLLRLNEDLGFLEYWSELDQPVLSAILPNRPPVVDGDTEMPCWGWAGCGCGPPLTVPARFVLRSADAADLFIQFLRDGQLPARLKRPKRSAVQPPLPGFPDGSVPEVVSKDLVRWMPPWPKVTPRYIQGLIE